MIGLALPLVLTVAIWVAARYLLPLPKPSGDYSGGAPIAALFRATICVILTLVVWLVYFVVLSFS